MVIFAIVCQVLAISLGQRRPRAVLCDWRRCLLVGLPLAGLAAAAVLRVFGLFLMLSWESYLLLGCLTPAVIAVSSVGKIRLGQVRHMVRKMGQTYFF